jgi:hypothetical protein
MGKKPILFVNGSTPYDEKDHVEAFMDERGEIVAEKQDLHVGSALTCERRRRAGTRCTRSRYEVSNEWPLGNGPDRPHLLLEVVCPTCFVGEVRPPEGDPQPVVREFPAHDRIQHRVGVGVPVGLGGQEEGWAPNRFPCSRECALESRDIHHPGCTTPERPARRMEESRPDRPDARALPHHRRPRRRRDGRGVPRHRHEARA